MFQVDIHKYKQSVKAALYELEQAIPFARKEHDHLLKVITGYGSSGGTHKIKTATLAYLEEKKGKGIKDYICGSDFSSYSEKFFSFRYLSVIPEDEKRNANPGVIYVIV